MLVFVGLGIDGYSGLSAKALDSMLGIKNIFVERYTSPMSEPEIDGLRLMLNKDVRVVPRWFVEDGREILQLAKDQDVALIVYGDPLIATTHLELRVRAERAGIRTKVLHGASAITSIIGESGLHMYKFGRTVTMTSEMQTTASIYYNVYSNLLSGNHTLILLEYNQEKNLFLSPNEGFKMLLESETNERHGAFSDYTFALVTSRIGMEEQSIISGQLKSLLDYDFGEPPHSLIIPGSLHFMENDAIKTLTTMLDSPRENTKNITTIAHQMISKYVPKARKALEQARKLVSEESEFGDVFDNAEYYITDAERFLHQQKPELAVLSIGYAEGLIDTIRFLKGVNVWD